MRSCLVVVGLVVACFASENVAWGQMRYGDAGSHHLGLGLGLGSSGGGVNWAAGAQYGHFFVDGLAPVLEADVSGGSKALTFASTMLALRWLPIRTGSVWPLIVPRAGRFFIEDFPDLWGAGGSLGIIIALSGRLGLQVAYEYLWLFPSDPCPFATNNCVRQGVTLGLVVGL